MQAILFRRVVVDGVNYYQLFKTDSLFEKDSLYADYNNRDSKDYFYIDETSNVEIPSPSILNIYYSDGNNLVMLDDKEKLEKVNKAFEEKYHYITHKMKPVKEIVKKIGKKILFQDECIRDLVNQIYLNQAVVRSDLPQELKLCQKNNILLHGNSGSGKKTIIDELKGELDIPYVDITLMADVKEVIENIIKKLLERANDNEEEASKGIVFIRDNFDNLYDIMGEKSYGIVDYITSVGPVNYHGKIIDFRTITFVTLLDRNPYTTIEEVEEIQSMTNSMYAISTRALTNQEKKIVLFSKDGRLHQYEKFLNQFGKKLIIDDNSLDEIIDRCSKLDPGMQVLNAVIDGIIKASLLDGIEDVNINNKCIDDFLPILDKYQEGKSDHSNKEEEFSFEKRVDEVTKQATKYVVGQDSQVRAFVYQLLENLDMANMEDLYNPKKYMQNILIRGNSGSGKTFIVNTVKDILNIPCYVVNATDYTEVGYVGQSPSDMFVGLYHAAGDDIEKAQKGIVVIDEIDKKARPVGGRDDGPSRGAVLDSLLKPTEGSVIRINIGDKINENMIDFDTSRVTFVCAGAFQGIEQIRDERIGKRKAGFGNQDKKDVDTSITNEDYVTYGMTEQFMGRVNGVIELNANSKELFMDIMKKSELSPLKTKQFVLANRGISLQYTEGFCEKLAEKALAMKQGVRGIGNALEAVLHSINIQYIRASEVEKIILDENVFTNPSEVILVPRENQKVKKK